MKWLRNRKENFVQVEKYLLSAWKKMMSEHCHSLQSPSRAAVYK